MFAFCAPVELEPACLLCVSFRLARSLSCGSLTLDNEDDEEDEVDSEDGKLDDVLDVAVDELTAVPGAVVLELVTLEVAALDAIKGIIRLGSLDDLE